MMDALTGIRAIAALWVVFYHYKSVSLAALGLSQRVPVFDYGFLGVDLFFLLSGFVITHVHGEDFPPLRWGAMRRFYGLRLARLYPVHLAVMLGLLVMILVAPHLGLTPNQPSQFSAFSFVKDLLLLQAWLPHPLTWNMPAWSISCEWFVYLLFPFFALGLRRPGTRGLLLWLVAELLLFAAAYAWLFGYDMDWNAGLALLRVAFEFSIGALIHRLAQHRDLSRVPWTAAVAGIAAAAILAGPLWRQFILILAFAAAILAGRYTDNLLSRVLSLSPLVYLGDVSYSLYMVHVPFQMTAGKLFERVLAQVHSRPLALTIAAAEILCVIAVAAATYHLIEWPARRWIRRRLIGRHDAPAAAAPAPSPQPSALEGAAGAP